MMPERNSESVKLPLGMIVVRWDNRLGAVLEAKYPPQLRVTEDQIMKIYTAHAMSIGEAPAGFLSLRVGDLNVASYYGGWDINYYVALILTPEEDADSYEDGLTEIASYIFSKLEDEAYKEELEELFNKLVRFPSLTEEQKMAVALSDPIRRALFEKMTEEGSSTLSDLETWLKYKFELKSVELFSLLTPLVKNGLISLRWVEGLPSQCAFLVRDVFVARVPARAIVKKAQSNEWGAEASSEYLDEVKDFFRNYALTPQDAENVIKVLADPDVYDVLVLLREDVCTFDKIVERLGKKKTEVARAVKQLKDLNFITEIKIGGEKHLALKSDARIITFFPEYMVDQIALQYKDQIKPPRMLLWHLKALRDSYFM
ncbi:MAG: winged helix-turn-helix domain-containing protein [Candidatus Jordarchaeales archaeon]